MLRRPVLAERQDNTCGESWIEATRAVHTVLAASSYQLLWCSSCPELHTAPLIKTSRDSVDRRQR